MASQEARQLERVGVVEGSQSAAANEDPAKTPALATSADPAANIYQRLWRIEQELEAVEKSQTATVKMEGGGSYSYKYSGHDLILSFVRPLFAKHGVKAWPTTVKHERVGNLTILTVRVDFINVDRPDEMASAETVNYGADKGDKGASKALTNAIREAMKKALNITSEEDKKADETTEFDPVEGASRKELEEAKGRAADSIVGWAQTFKTSIEGATTEKGLGRILAENAQRTTSPDLPAVTKTFFDELIARRKLELRGK